MSKAEVSAREVCEEHLKGKIRWNTEHHCSPRESAVAQRMLANGELLERYYAEIYPALNHDGIAWKHAIDAGLYAATYWRAQDIAQCRAGRKELEELREQISRQAASLADLLERRDALYNHSGFGADTYCSILDVIDTAAKHNGHYQGWVKEPLQALDRFDPKYWPTLSECLRVIGNDAMEAQIKPDNRLTKAATNSSRPSQADSVRALLQSIRNHQGSSLGYIPTSFQFTSAALADLVNVLFKIPTDSPVTEDYVKTERHRAKRGNRQSPANSKARRRA